jgi:hypothetical protein
MRPQQGVHLLEQSLRREVEWASPWVERVGGVGSDSRSSDLAGRAPNRKLPWASLRN